MARLKVVDISNAIKRYRGNLSAVARSLGTSRQAIYYRVGQSPKLQAELEEARETMLDEAENVLYEQVEGAQPWAVQFFLKTQGYKRGYVERREITGADGKEITIRYVNDWRDQAAESAPGSENGSVKQGATSLAGSRASVAEEHSGSGAGG